MRNLFPKNRSRVFLATTLLLMAVFSASAALALHPHERDGWQIGLGYGAATGDITISTGLEDSFPDGVSPQIRVGHSVGQHFSVEASYAGWMLEDGEWPVKYRLSLQNILAAVTWYPGDPNRPLGGFYVRGGLGLGWTRLSQIILSEEEEQGHGDHLQESGLGLELSLGYEFRITRNAAVGMAIGAQHMSINGDVYTEASFVPVTFTGAWYW